MFLRNQKGQSLIEYVILVALVAVACMGLVRSLQGTVRVSLANVVESLQGKANGSHHRSYEAIRDEDTRKSDFSDFMNGAANNRQ
jgi:Flp pilus assembly pilin Flp